MLDLTTNKRWIRVLLWLYAIHSSFVALGLMFIPAEQLSIFGLNHYQGSFFQVQAGIFHLVMAVAYGIAAKRVVIFTPLLFFIIIAKSIAFVFLLTYYIFFEQAWIIVLSAFGDGLMALILYLLCRSLPVEE